MIGLNITKAEARKDQIMAATFQCLFEGGNSRLTTRAVARKAGVSQATLQYYFKNKNALLTEFITRVFVRITQNLKSGFRESDPPMTKLTAIIDDGKRFVSQQKALFAVFVSCWSLCLNNRNLDKVLQSHYREFLAIFEQVVAHGQAEGVFRDLSPDSVGVLIFSFVNGLSLLRQDYSDAEKHFEFFANMLLEKLLVEK